MRTMLRIITVAIVMTFILAGSFDSPNVHAQQLQTVPVRFYQLNWLGPNGQVKFPCSKVGVARISVTKNTTQLLITNGGGFIQVMTQISGSQPTWSVRNLYLSYPNVSFMQASAPTVQFQLGVSSGTCVRSFTYSAVITVRPVTTFNLAATRRAVITISDYLVGGRNGGGSGFSTLPSTIGPWVGPSPSAHVQSTATTVITPGRIGAVVDEDIDGCAPAAGARSITYLAYKRIDTEATQDIYEDLVDLMNTILNGGGTTDPNMLAGKNDYASTYNLPIDSELVGWADIADVLDALDDGADVEILISWAGGGGHAAMVTSISGFDNGQYQITYVDDPTQGDGLAQNQEHTITVNPDGTFAGGRVDGFMVEERR